MIIDLESMKLADLKKLQAAVEAEILLKSSESPAGNRYSLFQHWYSALSHVLHNDEGIDVPPRAVFAQQRHAAGFTKALPAGERLVNEFRVPGTNVLKRPQETAARRLIFRTMLIWLRKRDVSISAASVCRNMQNAQAAVASEFPGYTHNGLLHMLIK